MKRKDLAIPKGQAAQASFLNKVLFLRRPFGMRLENHETGFAKTDCQAFCASKAQQVMWASDRNDGRNLNSGDTVTPRAEWFLPEEGRRE